MALSDMWRGGYNDIDQLKNWKRYVYSLFLLAQFFRDYELTYGSKSDVTSLYEEIKAIDADEEDDKAMGDVAPEKLTQNEEVRFRLLPFFDQEEYILNRIQRRTSMTWRALRQRTQTDIRSCTVLKDKRDLHLLFRKPIPKPSGDVVVGAGGVQESAKQEEMKDEEEDVTADPTATAPAPATETATATAEVKAEDTAMTIEPTTEVESEETTTAEVSAQETSKTTSGEVGEEEENKPVAEDDGWPKSDAAEVLPEVESGGMDVDRPATPEPEGLPAPDLEPA